MVQSNDDDGLRTTTAVARIHSPNMARSSDSHYGIFKCVARATPLCVSFIIYHALQVNGGFLYVSVVFVVSDLMMDGDEEKGAPEQNTGT